jgi:hypothetical protein
MTKAEMDAGAERDMPVRPPLETLAVFRLITSSNFLMAFDNEAETDDEKVRAVAAEISGTPLAPLSPEEIALREVERAAQQEAYRQRDEQIRQENLLEEAAKQEAAQRQAAIAAKAERDKAQQDRSREIDRSVLRSDLASLRFSAAQQTAWRNTVQAQTAQAVRQQNISHILGEINAMANPPAAPEPTVVVVEKDPQDDEFCGVKKIYGPNPRRSWW